MDLLLEVGRSVLEISLQAAPYVLFGLLLAGLLHVVVPESLILRWLGRPGMGGVVRAALVGVPLPVCSCGVVPITMSLRRKGASEPAALSFLTTTPESSIDSILLTWGLMGPVMAVARPVAAFFTAVVTGGLALFVPERAEGRQPDRSAEAGATSCGCGHHHGDLEDGPEHGGQGPVRRGGSPGIWRRLVRPALSYGFVELLDDMAFWLVGGLVAAGALGVLLPSDLAALGLGGPGWLSMVLALAVAVPLYMCASASTPIAAALVASGLSPGAALVFLLAGPATNVASLLLLRGLFGSRFVAIYLGGVVAGALGAGFALDLLIERIDLPVTALAHDHGLLFGWVEGASFLVLAGLTAWRLWHGAATRGWRGMVVVSGAH